MNPADSIASRNLRASTWCLGATAACSIVAYGLFLLAFAQALLDSELLMNVKDRDFANYWVAGRLVLSGEQQLLFDFGTYFERLHAIFGPNYPIHNWSYPPHFLLFLWPLGLLDYKVSMVVFLAATFALLLWAASIFRRVYAPGANRALLLLAVFGYTLMMVDTTQNGFLTAGAMLLGLAWMRQRPVLAGLAFAFLTIKPQLGILIPLVLIFERNWRAMAWSAIFTVMLVAASVALFGLQSWHAYLTDTLPYQRHVMTDWFGIFLRMMPTPFASLRTLGFPPEVAFLAQWPVSVLVAALTIWLFYKETDSLRRVYIALCATFLISPYGFNYDMGALAVASAVLAGSGALRGAPANMMVSIVAGLPAAVMNLGRANLPIAPLILAGGLAAIAVSTLREGDRAQHAGSNTARNWILRS